MHHLGDLCYNSQYVSLSGSLRKSSFLAILFRTRFTRTNRNIRLRGLLFFITQVKNFHLCAFRVACSFNCLLRTRHQNLNRNSISVQNPSLKLQGHDVSHFHHD